MQETNIKAGILLRQERIKRGYSQEELGASVGITFQQIQKYEKGINRISLPTLFAMCKFLQIKPESFVSQIGHDIDEQEIDLTDMRELLSMSKEARAKLTAAYKILAE